MNAQLMELHSRALECEAAGFDHLANYWREEIDRLFRNDVELMAQARRLPMFREPKPKNEIKTHH